jgi:branched-chain amino acid transport system substrate-binding protein
MRTFQLSRLALGLGLAFAALTANSAETVKVAFIDPLSGPFAPVGQNLLRSWQYGWSRCQN